MLYSAGFGMQKMKANSQKTNLAWYSGQISGCFHCRRYPRRLYQLK